MVIINKIRTNGIYQVGICKEAACAAISRAFGSSNRRFGGLRKNPVGCALGAKKNVSPKLTGGSRKIVDETFKATAVA